MKLQAGIEAPEFSLLDQFEDYITLASFRGRQVLIYFYPKADTPGCTTQACAIRDSWELLHGADLAVLGISPDEPEAQAKFDARYELKFPLLSDANHEIAEAYGVWGEKNRNGNTYMGIIRSSFLVDEEGSIQAAWYDVKPNETVSKALTELGLK